MFWAPWTPSSKYCGGGGTYPLHRPPTHTQNLHLWTQHQKVLLGVYGLGQRHASPPEGGIIQTWGPPVSFLSADKEQAKSAAWADLVTHKYQQADQSGAMCELRGSGAAIISSRCGPAALMMEGAEGAPTPNRLIWCQTNQHHLWCCVVSVHRSGFSGGWLFWIKQPFFFFFAPVYGFCYKTCPFWRQKNGSLWLREV